MKCPYCMKEMECGDLTSSHAIWWHKEQGLKESPNSISLTKYTAKGFLKAVTEGFSIDAYHCPACKKIILSYE